MGYTTEFDGSVSISPPLNTHEIAYLRKFGATRRMDRARGPYVVDGPGPSGQGNDDDIRDHNQPPAGQPGLWCKWKPTEDGTAITWNGHEKFYDSKEWMTYLIDTFLKPGALLASELASPVPGRHYPQELRHFSFDHELNGVIDARVNTTMSPSGATQLRAFRAASSMGEPLRPTYVGPAAWWPSS